MTALQPSDGWAELYLASNRPKEADHLAGNSDGDDGLGLACRRQPAITGAESVLGLRGDVANGLRQLLIAVMQFAADARLQGPAS